jgi:hypothetical protein
MIILRPRKLSILRSGIRNFTGEARSSNSAPELMGIILMAGSVSHPRGGAMASLTPRADTDYRGTPVSGRRVIVRH